MKSFALAAALAALLLAGCGESSQDKAQKTVCNARSDISKQVDQLTALTPATFSTDAVSKSLSTIQSDLSDIKNAQGDLSSDRRQQVQSATQAFTGQIKGIVSQIGSSTSAADAKTQITAALQQLGSAYKQAFAKVDCS